jgi:hypothetical protein
MFPDAVSDETAVALSMFLYDLACECERRYASQIRHYRSAQQMLLDPERPWKRIADRDDF